MTENGLDESIAESDTVGAFGPAVLTALSALREEILDMTTITSIERPRTAARRRHALVALAVAVALGAGATGAAAAGGFFARTGNFASGTGEDGTGEIIDVGAADAMEVISQLDADIPLPPGGTWDDMAARFTDDPSLMAESVLRSTMEWNAACQWATNWLDAEAVDDRAAMAMAERTLQQIPSWPGMVANNPDGGVRRIWETISAAAGSRDATGLRAAGYTANCTSN